MSATDRDAAAAIRTAILVSALGIAWQVASRATRDALFLSYFPVSRLPAMVAVAAVISLAAAFWVARLLGRFGPGKLAPWLYAGSAVVLLAAWALLGVAPRPAAVLVFIHISGFGALLISAFWSLVNERFDPRTAKRAFGRIQTAGTFGGVAGGLIAERFGAFHSVGGMLPLLAVLHLGAGVLVLRMRQAPARADAPSPSAEPPAGALRSLLASRYLILLASLVILGTVSEGLLDYVFKAAAKSAVSRGDELLRVFALFYAAVNVLGIVVGALFGRRSLERLGLARTVSLLPWSVAVTGLGAVAIPGLPSALFSRLAEAVMRNSLYRSGSELLLTPLPPREKRAVKPLLDVGAARIGDVAAAGLVQLALVAWAAQSRTLMLLFSIASAIVCVQLTYRVHRGYVATLERSLVSRAVHLNMGDVRDRTTRMTMTTMTGVADLENPEQTGEDLATLDPVLARLAELRSRDPARVRGALAAGPLEAAHVWQAIALLGRDDVVQDAIEALTEAAGQHTGQLVDALLDPATDFTVRRRLPAVLARVPSLRAIDGLFGGLEDERFEVRFRCGRALARLTADAPQLKIGPERVHAVLLREVAVDRHVWESQQPHEHDEGDAALALDGVLRERASRSLEHVFTVLALILPREPLQIAFHGLHAEDAQLRGTALEYLETALPVQIRVKLWPFLDAEAPRDKQARPREEVVAELLRSRSSIAISYEEVRRRSEGS